MAKVVDPLVDFLLQALAELLDVVAYVGEPVLESADDFAEGGFVRHAVLRSCCVIRRKSDIAPRVNVPVASATCTPVHNEFQPLAEMNGSLSCSRPRPAEDAPAPPKPSNATSGSTSCSRQDPSRAGHSHRKTTSPPTSSPSP